MKIDWKKFSNSPGYKSLKKDMLRRVYGEKWSSSGKCFNTSGCNKQNHKCRKDVYCQQFKWIIDRAKHYSHVTGIEISKILNAWEENRSFWFANYYQDSSQPKLNVKDNNILIFNSTEEAKNKFLESGFICPSCGGETITPYECKGCGWKVYGLLQTGKEYYWFFKDKCRGEKIFPPASLSN